MGNTEFTTCPFPEFGEEGLTYTRSQNTSEILKLWW